MLTEACEQGQLKMQLQELSATASYSGSLVLNPVILPTMEHSLLLPRPNAIFGLEEALLTYVDTTGQIAGSWIGRGQVTLSMARSQVSYPWRGRDEKLFSGLMHGHAHLFYAWLQKTFHM